MSERGVEADAGLRPSSETGVYLRRHEHQWQQVGAKHYPAGSWHPVFTCEVCGDVICDLHVEVDVLGHVVPPAKKGQANA